MTPKELAPLFPPACYLDKRVLLVPPAELHRLEGYLIHGSRMFMLVCRGSLHLELNGLPHQLKAPSFFDIMETSSIQLSALSSDLQAWCLFVTFEFAGESLKNLRPGPPDHLLKRFNKQEIPIQSMTEEESQLLEQQLLLLKNTLASTNHHYKQELAELYFRSFSLEMGNMLFHHEEELNDGSAYIGKQDFITLDFMKLVSAHYATEHHIEFYAEALCVSTKHLTRIIKEMTGKTPRTIICDEIVHQAMKLLEDDQIPIGQIAEELHFADQASFCKFFKKQKQVSPMVYRKKMNRDTAL